MTSAPVSARDVSTYITSKLADGRHLETVKLQKLLFFCQGWTFGATGQPLFEEDFEAWTYGPVAPEIYKLHRGEAKVGADFYFGGDATRLDAEQKQLVDGVIDTYGGVNTFRLVYLTHQRGTPWFNAAHPDGNTEETQYSALITKDAIRDYFRQEAKRINNGGAFIT